jgi:hypothetical protein
MGKYSQLNVANKMLVTAVEAVSILQLGDLFITSFCHSFIASHNFSLFA